jgi:hypothetical protein
MIGHVVLKIFTNLPEAQIVKGLLEVNGIDSHITADDCGGVRSYMNFSTGVKLWIKKEDLPKAIDFLRELDSSS